MSGLLGKIGGSVGTVVNKIKGQQAQAQQGAQTQPQQSQQQTQWAVQHDAAAHRFFVDLAAATGATAAPAPAPAPSVGGLTAGLAGLGLSQGATAGTQGATGQLAVLDYKLLGVTGPCTATGAAADTTMGATATGATVGAPTATATASVPCTQAQMLNITVPEAFRHKGVGTALAVAFLQWCRSPNGPAICDVALPNADVRKFLEAHMDELASTGFCPMLSSRKPASAVA